MSSVEAQQIPAKPDKCYAFYPEALNTKVLEESAVTALVKSSDYGQSKPPRNLRYWIAFSDRVHNTVYSTPNGASCGELEFNQQVRIAKVQSGWALVYHEPIADEAYPRISQDAVMLGWIPMSNLLLWNSAIANNGIYNKALLCVNLDEVGEYDPNSSSIGKLYHHPNKRYYEPLKSDMSFYFVMKREGDLALLSKVHSMYGIDQHVLIGWLPKDSYVEWNQRSCLEPNWDPKVVEYFAAEQTEVGVYETPDLSNIVNRVTFRKKPKPAKYDRHLYRLHPDQLRFPILDNRDGKADQYKCSSFGTADGSASSAEKLSERSGAASAYKEEVLRKMTNIDIGIVIDGTKSMEVYYPAIKNSIKRFISVYDKQRFKVRIGLVIYRDHGDGEFITEKISLTNPSNRNIDSFLDTGGKYGIKSGRGDTTYEEALYYGINTAIDQLGFNKDHSNILLVIGDCGNDPKDTSVAQSTIIQKLVEKNINIIGFQVWNEDSAPYSRFTVQMQRIITESLNKRYDDLKGDTKVYNEADRAATTSNVRMKRTKDGYDLVNDDANLFFGSLNYAPKGQKMPATKLEDLIHSTIIKSSDFVQKNIHLITLAGAKGYASSNNGEAFSKFELWFVRKKLGEANLEILQEVDNAMYAFKGYAPKHDAAGRDYFKPVIFISSDELNTLIERLAPVSNAANQFYANTNADRAPYINALKGLIQAMIPDDLSDARMNSMTYSEIMQLASGLNESSDALKGHSLMELADPNIVKHEAFSSLVSNFISKYKIIQSMKTITYKYSKFVNGIKYYWLPVEDLP